MKKTLMLVASLLALSAHAQDSSRLAAVAVCDSAVGLIETSRNLLERGAPLPKVLEIINDEPSTRGILLPLFPYHTSTPDKYSVRYTKSMNTCMDNWASTGFEQ